MTAYIEEIVCFNEAAIRAGNEYLEVVLVPKWGSNLISLKWKKGNLELLRTPSTKEEYISKPYLYGIPILFPPNRIDRGEFTYNQKTYRFYY
ncbi:aldose 1-epimerase [Fictibacillus sp. FJAT-27399]|uniref:aldose epimerase family protein n=1 Tax=Fictibacillus sp. FJAT-27399 TaxID=1729689 RepID=UPI000784A0F3|nr:aldose 1-epimerase [Fictibacillus sp. FJAT-27399]